MVDNQEQYSRRPGMVITGMATPDEDISNNDDQEAIINVIQKETGIQRGKIQESIDKTHPIDKSKQEKEQRIVKFETDSFEEVVYHKHKNRIKMTKQNQQHDNANVGARSKGIKFKPSLTKKRINLLQCYDNVVKDIKAMKFVYADIHSNCKLMFNKSINRKFMHTFNSKMELAEMIARIDHEDPSEMYSHGKSYTANIITLDPQIVFYLFTFLFQIFIFIFCLRLFLCSFFFFSVSQSSQNFIHHLVI